MSLSGKGFYIWQIKNCEGGNAQAIAAKAQAANLSHVLIKIADTTNAFGFDRNNVDLVPAVATALRNRNIQVWGWHYVKGDNPVGEARIAVQRSRQLALDGYVIDAEIEYRTQAKVAAARSFMSELRSGLPKLPIALSSFRYPSFHQALPWREFLEKCDYNMPQVYWEQAHNAEAQLERCCTEFRNTSLVGVVRPVIPTGSAYGTGGWRATPDDLRRFFQKARDLTLTAASAYSWDWATSAGNTDLWEAVAGFNWPIEASPSPVPPVDPTPPPPVQPQDDILTPYFQALNHGDVDKLVSLYQPNAAQVTAKRTVIGSNAIRNFYNDLFVQMPNATFTLEDTSGQPPTRIFSWSATSGQRKIVDGHDTLGLREGRFNIITQGSQFNNRACPRALVRLKNRPNREDAVGEQDTDGLLLDEGPA